jgi:hypothetical protein
MTSRLMNIRTGFKINLWLVSGLHVKAHIYSVTNTLSNWYRMATRGLSVI